MKASFVRDTLTAISIEDTFLQYFLVILRVFVIEDMLLSG